MSNLLKGLFNIVKVQPGSSVLNLSTDSIFDNVSNTPGLCVNFAQVDVSQDPNTQYSLVLAANLSQEFTNCDLPCLETQEGPLLNLNLAALEWGARCCTMGGLLISILPEQYFDTLFKTNVWNWLCDKGVILVFCKVENSVILVYRHKLKYKDYTLQKETFDTEDDWINWSSGHAIFKTGVCTEDPGPLELKTWNIYVKNNNSKNNYVSDSEPKVTYFYKGKNKACIRWADNTVALEWAQHQALQQPPDPSWDKTVEKFNQRLSVDTFMRIIETTALNKILNIPDEYKVTLDSSFQKYLKRKKLQMDLTLTAYPEKSTLENKYFTLGPGSKLLRDDGTTWKINFSEPDFGSYKPPRLHIEQEQ